MARFNLDEYVSVADRITTFWELYPEGAIRTDLEVTGRNTEGLVIQFIVKAEVFQNKQDNQPIATGYAEERKLDSNKGLPNESSPLENCESQAIGRALRNLGFEVQKPSREEMAKVNRNAERQARPELKELTEALGKFGNDNLLSKAEVWDTVQEILKRKASGVEALSPEEVQSVLEYLKAIA